MFELAPHCARMAANVSMMHKLYMFFMVVSFRFVYLTPPSARPLPVERVSM